MLKLNGIRLVRFEPDYHTTNLYQWYYSGDCLEFFRDYPQCPSAVEMAQAAQGKTFMIVREHDAEIVGMVQYFNVNETARNFELGLLIDNRFEGQGLVPLALKTFLNWRFNYCNFFKAKMKVLAKNKRACDILERFGAMREGGPGAVLKRESFFAGKFHDVAAYAILKTDFNQLYSEHFESIEPRLEPPKTEAEVASGRVC